jgi:hypothetical protein
MKIQRNDDTQKKRKNKKTTIYHLQVEKDEHLQLYPYLITDHHHPKPILASPKPRKSKTKSLPLLLPPYHLK